jgi:hypothetical protein
MRPVRPAMTCTGVHGTSLAGLAVDDGGVGYLAATGTDVAGITPLCEVEGFKSGGWCPRNAFLCASCALICGFSPDTPSSLLPYRRMRANPVHLLCTRSTGQRTTCQMSMASVKPQPLLAGPRRLGQRDHTMFVLTIQTRLRIS